MMLQVVEPKRDDPSTMATYWMACSPGAAPPVCSPDSPPAGDPQALEKNWMDVEPDQLKESPVDMVGGMAHLHAILRRRADGHDEGDQADKAVREPRRPQAAGGLDEGLWAGGLAALCCRS